MKFENILKLEPKVADITIFALLLQSAILKLFMPVLASSLFGRNKLGPAMSIFSENHI